jgi:pimeloyl-ACP methyl ester carboxylesterase
MAEGQQMQLHHEVAGSGSHTIVLTHGLAGSGTLWREQVRGLSGEFRMVTWDLRGHGESGAATGTFTLADLAEDLGSVIDDVGIDRAVVLGHSAGGVIAMRFALDHPERVEALILVGTAGQCNERAANFYEQLAALAVEDGMESVHRNLGLAAEGATAGDPVTFARVARCMANLLNEPLTPEVERIRCPTLIIVGGRDFLGAGGSVILSRRIPGSRLEIVPERGHGIFLEDPESFNAMVKEFVRTLPQPPRPAASGPQGSDGK